MEPTLSTYNHYFVSNIELLRKSKEDSRIDTMLRGTMNGSRDSFDHNINDRLFVDLDSNAEELLDTLDEVFSTKTLIAVYHSVVRS